MTALAVNMEDIKPVKLDNPNRYYSQVLQSFHYKLKLNTTQ